MAFRCLPLDYIDLELQDLVQWLAVLTVVVPGFPGESPTSLSLKRVIRPWESLTWTREVTKPRYWEASWLESEAHDDFEVRWDKMLHGDTSS